MPGVCHKKHGSKQHCNPPCTATPSAAQEQQHTAPSVQRPGRAQRRRSRLHSPSTPNRTRCVSQQVQPASCRASQPTGPQLHIQWHQSPVFHRHLCMCLYARACARGPVSEPLLTATDIAGRLEAGPSASMPASTQEHTTRVLRKHCTHARPATAASTAGCLTSSTAGRRGSLTGRQCLRKCSAKGQAPVVRAHPVYSSDTHARVWPCPIVATLPCVDDTATPSRQHTHGER